MIRPFAPMLLATVAVALSSQAGRMPYRSPDGNVSMLADGGKGKRLADGYELTLVGAVRVITKTPSMNLAARRVVATTLTPAKGTIQLRRAVATGAVELVQNRDGQSVRILASTADFRAGTSENVVDLGGPVTLQETSAQKKRTLDAAGSTGFAALAPGAQGKLSGPLRRAELRGNVRVKLREANGDPLNATADRMEVRTDAKGSVVVLRGRVGLNGGVGTFRNLREATFRLNTSGEVQGFDWVAALPTLYAQVGGEAPEEENFFETANGRIYLRNFQRGRANTLEGTADFEGTGTPAMIEDTGSGLTISGARLTAGLRRTAAQTDPKTPWQLERATAAGEAFAIQDAEIAYRSANAIKPTPLPPRFARTRLDAEQFVFTRAGELGTLDIAVPMVVTSTMRGNPPEVPYTQETRITGKSAALKLDFDGPKPKGPHTIDVVGPVTLASKRTTSAPNRPVEVSNLSGEAGRLQGDFTLPQPLLTATGGFRLTGDGTAFGGNVRGERMTITLDESLQPVRYDFFGKPVQTEIQQRGGGR